MQPDASRTIPSATKRLVRQKSGFGCVICGNPIVQYDHIVEWSKTHDHDSNNIAALCPEHHDDKTHGRLPVAVIRKAVSAPHNRMFGASKPKTLMYGPEIVEIIIGDCSFTAARKMAVDAIVVDGETLVGFRFEGGVCLVTLRLYDRAGNILVLIEDNELMVSPHAWDIEFVGQTLTVRSARGVIEAEIRFETPHRIIVVRGTLRYRSSTIRITRRGLTISHRGASSDVRGLRGEKGQAGIVLGRDRLERAGILFAR